MDQEEYCVLTVLGFNDDTVRTFTETTPIMECVPDAGDRIEAFGSADALRRLDNKRGLV